MVKVKQMGKAKVKDEAKMDDAGRGGAKMKMRIFELSSL